MSHCKKHPTYMAKRKPTADCEACREIWTYAQFLILAAKYDIIGLVASKPRNENVPAR